MQNPFIQKLEHGCDLTDDDRVQLQRATAHPVLIAKGHTLIHEGDVPKNVHVILEGFACRYKQMDNGKRQITAYLLPGDLCDLHVNILREMDHSIGTLTPCKVARVPPETIEWLMSSSLRINRALWWAALIDVSTCRAWMTSMGQQTGERQIGHLLCELLARLQAVGWADNNSYELPLTQRAAAHHVERRPANGCGRREAQRVCKFHAELPSPQNLCYSHLSRDRLALLRECFVCVVL